ncbi:MAG: zinc ribbon domain-containing protein [Ruminococcus sp.]|nr:zinc ribbon domain-containing protein [Ruminococcus sp.]
MIMLKFDGIFDDVMINAKAAANAVSKRASGVYDSSKQRIAAAEIKSDINKKLRELGLLAYKANTENAEVEAEATKLIAEISDLKENLEVINQNLMAMKNKRRCPECDALVPKNSVYCNLCGSKIVGAEDYDVDDFETETDVFSEKSLPTSDIADEFSDTSAE